MAGRKTKTIPTERYEWLHYLAQGAGQQGHRRRGRGRPPDRPRRGLFPEGDWNQLPARALSRRVPLIQDMLAGQMRLHLRAGGEDYLGRARSEQARSR